MIQEALSEKVRSAEEEGNKEKQSSKDRCVCVVWVRVYYVALSGFQSPSTAAGGEAGEISVIL